MEGFLRRIKLIDDISIRLNVTIPEFVSALRDNVEESDIDGIFSGAFEAFSSNKKIYKGLVDGRGFYIRKKRKFFDKNKGMGRAKGAFKINGDVLVVNTKISAFSLNKLIFMSFAFVCYIIFIFYPFGDVNSFDLMFNNIPNVFFIFLVGIPIFSWFSLKREVTKMKQELEKHFHLITNKVNN